VYDGFLADSRVHAYSLSCPRPRTSSGLCRLFARLRPNHGTTGTSLLTLPGVAPVLVTFDQALAGDGMYPAKKIDGVIPCKFHR
jgi:hypothetical protein